MEKYREVIAWILSLKKGRQITAILMFLIIAQFYIIISLSQRNFDLINRADMQEVKSREEIDSLNAEFNNFLMQANKNAQSMKDSLYLSDLKIEQIKNSKK